MKNTAETKSDPVISDNIDEIAVESVSRARKFAIDLGISTLLLAGVSKSVIESKISKGVRDVRRSVGAYRIERVQAKESKSNLSLDARRLTMQAANVAIIKPGSAAEARRIPTTVHNSGEIFPRQSRGEAAKPGYRRGADVFETTWNYGNQALVPVHEQEKPEPPYANIDLMKKVYGEPGWFLGKDHKIYGDTSRPDALDVAHYYVDPTGKVIDLGDGEVAAEGEGRLGVNFEALRNYEAAKAESAQGAQPSL